MIAGFGPGGGEGVGDFAGHGLGREREGFGASGFVAELQLFLIEIGKARAVEVYVGCGHADRVLAEAGDDGAGFDEADADAGVAEFDPLGVGEGLDREFGGGVDAEEGQGDAADDAGDVHDTPVFPLQHLRQHRVGQFLESEDIGFELTAHGVAGQVLEGAGLSVAGVVHETVDAVADRRDGVADRVGGHDIEGDGLEALVAQHGQIRLFAGGGADGPAEAAHVFGGGEADAGGAAGDEDDGWIGGVSAHSA